MIITNHAISLGTSHSYIQEYRVSESLYTQQSENDLPVSPQATTASMVESEDLTQNPTELQIVSLSRSPDEIANDSARVRNNGADSSQSDSDLTQLDAQTYNLKMLVEQFTGKKIELYQHRTADHQQSDQGTPQQPARVDALIYKKEESYYEYEASSFDADGIIAFGDGKSLQFNFSAYSERSFFASNTTAIRVGSVEVIDPLIINLDNKLNLTQARVKFDLNNDGQSDSIYFATGSSGFLAIDKNDNGKIDDGSEVIGALSGDGFKELEGFDRDNNRFIDEADTVFNHLRFFQIDEQGKTQLRTLNEVGVGALFVGSAKTPFDVKDNDNQSKALVRSSGIFLYQNKSVGSLQQIDLVI